MATATAKKLTGDEMKDRMQGVYGRLVSVVDLGDIPFGPSERKTSPYRPLLEQLRAAAPGSALEFPRVRALSSIKEHAKKLRLSLVYARSGGKLYVKLAPPATEPPATVKDTRQTNRDLILSALSSTPRTTIAIAEYVRKNGNSKMDATLAETILGQLLRDGKANERIDKGVSWWTLSA